MSSPALLFDLDGTLVDTAPDLLAALNAVLSSEDRKPVDLATLRHLVGHGARMLIEQAMAATGEPALPERLPALIDRFVAHYRDHLVEHSRPFPRVEETLQRLSEAGARMAVITNKPEVLTLPILHALDLAGYFAVICGAGHYDFIKPDARIVKHVVEELGGLGTGAAMIGDSVVDLATARAAQIPALLVSYGYSQEPVNSLGADAIIDSFAQIPFAVAEILRPGANGPRRR